MPKYKKAPKFEGSDLTLDLGRKILKPEDGVLYDDPKLARFVSLGMMVKVEEEAAPPAAPAPKAKPAPVSKPSKEEAEEEAETTKYTESELAKNNKAALADLGAGMGLELDMSMTKADMIEAILGEQG